MPSTSDLWGMQTILEKVHRGQRPSTKHGKIGGPTELFYHTWSCALESWRYYNLLFQQCHLPWGCMVTLLSPTISNNMAKAR